jgi:ArsR family transcriptional regulator, arsenate/arsenite/antimonite-responsive transcriptional repressor
MKKSLVIEALGGLAQDTRLDIFRLLVQRGPEGLAAGVIGERLELPLPTLSFHLAQLKHAGLVNARRESRSIIYSANYKMMNDLLAYLTENCCGGRKELCVSVPGTADSASEGVQQETFAPRRTRRAS